ncbi:MAG TPA: DUF368 domain-containing protein [Euzebya sp.]|nr:DUF368 domain-containing protein [Euzebya sp.]
MPTPPPPDAVPAREGPVVLRFAQGMAMGTADVIPGVSGGTVALIVGIYAMLIAAIRSVASALAALVRGRPAAAGGHWRMVPWAFVLPLGVGIVAALGVGSVVLPPLLETYPSQTSAVFFGMIVASLAVPWRDAGEPGTDGVGMSRVALAVAFAVLAFLVTGLPEAAVADDPAIWRIFASAAVAICAMILPGVSGAFLLLVLGVYEPTLEALRNLDLAYVGTFVLGAVVGLGVFSKLLGHLLEHRLGITMAALTGLMLGALRRLWPWGGAEGDLHAPPDVLETVVVAALVLIGFAVVRTLIVVGDRRGHPHEVEEAVDILDDSPPANGSDHPGTFGPT